MSVHKFRIGQIVTYRPDQRGQDVPPGAYMITARLPESADGQFENRIKHGPGIPAALRSQPRGLFPGEQVGR